VVAQHRTQRVPRVGLVRAAPALLLLILVVVIPSSARASGVREIDFKNPSGNARCVATKVSGKPPFLACAVLSTATAALNPEAWWLDPREPVTAPTRPDNWIGRAVPVIPYGQTRRFFGVFHCSSLTIGLLCWSTQSSHGFLLSTHHQFTF
jgi:hypothetical protein